MFNKNLIFLLINICLCSSELIISPSDYIEINEGEKLVINCTASEDVEFIYPITIPDWIDRSEAELSTSDGQGNRLFKSTLKRPNLVFEDSGWYGCIEKSKNQFKPPFKNVIDVTPYNYDKKDIKWVYVTVKSTEYSLQEISFLSQDVGGEYVLFKKVGDNATLPCRATSAASSVKLYDSVYNVTIKSFDYDIKNGITIKNIEKDGFLQYYCQGEKTNGTNGDIKAFKIALIDEFQDRPFIINSDGFAFMRIGKDFKMECTSLVSKYESCFLDWTVPETDHITKEYIVESDSATKQNESIYKKLTVVLMIKNVTAEDFGNYECRLYKYGSVESTNINLKPHEKKHVKISLRNPSSDVIELDAGHTWTIDVDSYPIPFFSWIDPQGNQIYDKSEFKDWKVNDEKFSINFTKNEFRANDLGIHTIVARISDTQESKVTFKVVARTRPKLIEVMQNKACLAKGALVYQCRARGYPVPEIHWACMSSEIRETEVEYKILRTEYDEFETSSTVMVNECMSGFVSCRAKTNDRWDLNRVPVILEAAAEESEEFGIDDCPIIEEPKVKKSTAQELLETNTEFSPRIIEIRQTSNPKMLFQIAYFSCQVLANPPATITWEYLNELQALISYGHNLIKTKKILGRRNSQTAIVEAKIPMPGYLLCRAKNSLGEVTKLVKIEIDDNEIQVQHNETKVQHNETQVQHNETKVQHNETQIHHNETQINHNETQVQHNETKVQHNETQIHHNETKVQHDETQIHHNETKVQHNETKVQHDETQIHHNETKVQHNETQIHHNETQGQDTDNKLPAATTPTTTPVIGEKDPKTQINETTKQKPEDTGFKNPDSKNKSSTTEPTKPDAKKKYVDPFSLDAGDQEVNTTEGSTVTLHCNASTSLFNNDIKWYNASYVLATGGRVVIKETKEATLHSLHLTITDVQLWDKGDYSCEGTKKNGSNVKKLYHVHINASAAFSASVILTLSIILLSYFM